MGFAKLLPNNSLVSYKKHKQFNQLNMYTNIFHVFSDWQMNVLLKNSINRNKIHKVSHGVKSSEHIIHKDIMRNSILTIGYSGRITKDKGLHILIQALKELDNPNIKLIVNGIIDPNEQVYYTMLLKESNNLQIEWMVKENDKNFYSKIDLLCVPSQVLETGPLVVYEALLHQTPILGSNIGGIAEKIDDLKIGWTFNFNEINDLKIKINNIYTQPSLLNNLNLKQQTVPSFIDAAFDVKQTYLTLNAK